MVDALVSLGYPFGDLMRMTYTDLLEWLDVAGQRGQKNDQGA